MAGSKLTTAQRKMLSWYAQQSRPVDDFSREGPTLNMRRWGVRHGYLTPTAASITPSGRAALAAQQKERDNAE